MPLSMSPAPMSAAQHQRRVARLRGADAGDACRPGWPLTRYAAMFAATLRAAAAAA
jgi:hypothetical protein